MRVNASLGFWYFLIFVIVWRQFLKVNTLQQTIHGILRGWLAPVVQWHAIFLGGVFVYVAYSIYEMMTEYDSLDQATITSNLNATFHLQANARLRSEKTFAEFRESLVIEPWLRCLNLASQFLGLPIVIIAAVHVWRLLALPSKLLAENHVDGKFAPWKPPTRMNWLLLVITMPTMFCAMSMRATCRILAVMTGTAWGHDVLPWPRVQSLEHAMYTSDLELAALFQFSSVYAFARICGSILSDRVFLKVEGAAQDAAEYARVIKAAGFLGVWAFVAVGMVRSLFGFLIAEAEQFESLADTANRLQMAALSSISTVFTAITILCVINMFIMCKMSIITDKLGNATQKFMGTRLLLLAFEIQARIVSAFTVGSTMYRQVDKHAEKYGIPIHNWKFSKEQACLFHLSLLNFQCLAVVIFNLVVWRGLDLEASGIVRFKPPVKLSSNSDEGEGLLDESMDF